MPGKHKNRKSFASPSRRRGQHLSEKERIQILTLYNSAKWNQSAIARELRIARTTPYRLIAKATSNASYRRYSLSEVAQDCRISACARVLAKAFEKERYFRRVAAKKPLLTEQHKRTGLPGQSSMSIGTLIYGKG
ncbi:hypothetical protein BDY21DRAFT_198224 [Lineolata rhizophorae]|uniref:Uncharacterized protein n=1 Tax=Lineolata rhizophorae TaxID=578093 RepID=A0A6A6P596_9PEZI|nr:hypothetical protein BDY21DRAFT_198224 [Lineolata rhizophorae]